MNTALSRLNAVFAFSLTVLAVSTFFCFLSTAFRDRTSKPELSASPISVDLSIEAMASGPEEKDHADFKFNLATNLSHLFDWNTKELFVMLVAHYRTPKNVINQVILYDKIILRGDSPILDLRNNPFEYDFFDDGNGFLGNKNVTLELCWNVVPHAGLLPVISSGSVQVQFPPSYSTPRGRRM